MKFSFSRKINCYSEFDRDRIISILNKNISNTTGLFSDKFLIGKVENYQIRVKINSSSGFVDPFKSKIQGSVENDNGRSYLSFVINPSWTIIIFLIVWIVLTILMLFSFEFNEIWDSLKFWGIALLWIVFPFLLTMLKINWDKKRLEIFLNDNI